MEYYSFIRMIMKNFNCMLNTCFMLKERCRIQNVIKYF